MLLVGGVVRSGDTPSYRAVVALQTKLAILLPIALRFQRRRSRRCRT